ncbi:MAG: S-adenosylmethionine:tRNA ribosyltransferase-isomerase, partial [Bdellovibrionota bacterium]
MSENAAIDPIFDLNTYRFELPLERIAQTPVEPRDASKLLVLHRKTGVLEHRHFRDLPEYLGPSDLLVANNSKVIRARLLGHRVGSGGRFEFLLLERSGPKTWIGLYHASARAKPGMQFEVPPPKGASPTQEMLIGTVTSFPGGPERAAEYGGAIAVEFDRDPEAGTYGEIPLPPYIQTDDPNQYEIRY